MIYEEKDFSPKMLRTREKVINTAYNLFIEKSVYAVTMENIAKAAGIGVASVYRYFGTKDNLVVAVNEKKMNTLCTETVCRIKAETGNTATAADQLAKFFECVADIYADNKELLRFSAEFKGYAVGGKLNAEQLEPCFNILKPIEEWFHELYETAQKDGSLKVNTTEDKMFLGTVVTILIAAENYAEGFVWPFNRGERDYEKELRDAGKSIMYGLIA